jgi:hypothetical protein
MNIHLNLASAVLRGKSSIRQLAAFAAVSAVLLPVPAAHAQSNYATPYAITTVAGVAYVPGNIDGTGRAARFNGPSGTAVDSNGNVYVADQVNDTIRKITPSGVVTTLAGTPGVVGSSDGTGSAAKFNAPVGVAVDGSGNVYVADATNETIRKVTPAGVVTTLAGTVGVAGHVDATGSAAQFSSPVGVAVDGAGNIYVVDQTSDTIRKVTQAGVVTTLTGSNGVVGFTDGAPTIARFNSPYGIACDSAGNVYVADSGNLTVRKVLADGTTSTLAGSARVSGTTNGTGSAALFKGPAGIAADGSGNVYVSDQGGDGVIRMITSGGVVTTLAGHTEVNGYTDATGTSAEFQGPFGLSVDASGTVYVADQGNDMIRKITSGGVVTTLAGSSGSGFADGTGAAAQLNAPGGIATDSSGNVYIADQDNQEIRKMTPAGVVTTIAGSPGNGGSADGTGPAAQFYFPFGVAVDGAGNVFVADSLANTIRKITPGGAVTTLAGSPFTAGSSDGTGSAALFNDPFAIAVDSNDVVYVSERKNNTIRKVTQAGAVTTLAGTAGSSGSNDGTGAAARFNLPAGLAVDSNGNVFVADATNDTIRKITSAGVVTTIAGSPQQTGSTDGTGSAARFFFPVGLALDSSGNIYVTDDANNTIREVTQAGVVTTLAGNAALAAIPSLIPGSSDGTGPAALFNAPAGIAVDSLGNLYVSDTGNYTIRRGTLSGAPLITAQPTDQYVSLSGSATFSVTASGSSSLTYQWYLNGAAISGATGSSYTIANAQASDGGPYTVTVTDSDGSTTSNVGNLFVNSGTSTSRLVNISTRATVGTGGNILIPGLVIGGSGTETLLVRGDGPALTQFSVPGVLLAPSLSVYDSNQHLIASNTAWGTNTNPAQIASVSSQVGAFALVSGSKDCALIATLPAGAYTVQISGVGATTGVALAEVYEVASTGTARLVNISTRATVGTGGNILIPGFVISGSGSEQLLVRADGPSLAQFSVPGILAQPSLGVYNSAQVQIASNTGWGTASNPAQIASVAASVGAFAFVSGSADSAQIVNLPAGAYTIQISGVANTTGVALAEIYEVP